MIESAPRSDRTDGLMPVRGHGKTRCGGAENCCTAVAPTGRAARAARRDCASVPGFLTADAA
ncbi:hypothetical protein WT63_14705 [Burkholderia anthina]|nr:hypothetical protein WT63_14705 [Burkholderia anthina]